MPHKHQDWRAILTNLPVSIHVSFYQRKQGHWIARWRAEKVLHQMYMGKESPIWHLCFQRRCNHFKAREPQYNVQPSPPRKRGYPIGYQPGEETIQRLSAAHRGKKLSQTHRLALREAKLRRNAASGSVPSFRHIAGQLKEQIEQGRWQAGQKLPRIVDAAQQYSVGKDTMHRAYQLLAAEHLVVLRPRQGTFVADVPKNVMLSP